MRAKGTKLLGAVLLAVVGGAPVARAEETAPPEPETSKAVQALPWFVGLAGGAGYATISHPDVVAGGTAVSVLTLNGGYTFGDHLTLGLEFSSSETSVGRDTATEQFELGYSPQEIWRYSVCSPCEPKWHGQEVASTSLVFTSLGARAEYAPFGRDGLFVGGMAGMAFLVGLGDEPGFGFGARVGYRYRATSIMTFSIEAGMAGQLYGDANMYMPFGVAVLRPYFLSGVRKYPAKPPAAPR